MLKYKKASDFELIGIHLVEHNHSNRSNRLAHRVEYVKVHSYDYFD